ncbi:substrate of the Dot/Icm secretion system [Legionella santicrucis]|uniref:Substrate of the Dot/Icm secretion system n=1 Tax=Legionella santicrucis TaxID=45074 RepID=A0A0W0YFW0_9GAMM|nr:hypothetical protein [Legionella santicrucis]KTD55567.1 substrate of the Dot/Icm secretion system [Legionella santicrucis]
MSIEKYIEALKASTVDSADSVLITIRIIEHELGHSQELNLVKQAFAQNDYKRTFDLIESLINPTLLEKNEELFALICEKIATAFEHDNPHKNWSRRYFDTRLSQELWNIQNANYFSSIEKLASLMIEKNRQFTPSTQVKSLDEAEDVIKLVRDFGEKTHEINTLMGELRSMKTSISNSKDRGPKRKLSEGLISQNPGIVKSISPMPVDELLTTAMCNKVADVFEIDPSVVRGYSKTNTQVPYVNSVSGTTFVLVAVLTNYIEKYKNDPNLENDTNHIIQAFFSFTCKCGYHSLAEMQDVLNDPAVREIFANNNITIHDIPQKALDAAIAASCHYATRITLQHKLHEDISEGSPSLTHVESNDRSKPSLSFFRKSYPTELSIYGVRENKATGPRVTEAIKKIKEEKGNVPALKVAFNFMHWARQKHRHFNTTELKELIGKMRTEIHQEICNNHLDNCIII